LVLPSQKAAGYDHQAEQAASPRGSLIFMFWGAGLFVMPLTLAYTFVVYRLFHGKVVDVGYE
jgi:cytochrome d ubiquinol oxidase subunit II